MSNLSADDQGNESRLDQIHDYIRHSFQLFLTWFALFAGINDVALGWLGSSSGATAKPPRLLILALALNLIIQNLLGIIAALIVKRALTDLASKAYNLEGPDTIVPIALYRGSVVLIGIALFVTASIWAFVMYIS
jgi:hypothetical protein